MHQRTLSARQIPKPLPSMPRTPSSPLPFFQSHDDKKDSRSYSSLQSLSMSSSSSFSSTTASTPTPSSSLTSMLEILNPRKSRQRTTYLALLALVLVSTYILLVAHPSMSGTVTLRNPHYKSASPADASSPWRQLANYAAKHRDARPASPAHPQVQLNAAQELAALTSFMAALPQNVLPPTVDPARALDPQLVLDFDTRSARAAAEVDEVVNDAWTRNPVVIFSKLRSPVSRELKSLIYDMHLKPSPTVFEIDQRADAEVVTPLLFRLTNATVLPILLVGGTPIGTIDDVRDLVATGELARRVAEAGAVPQPPRGRKGGKKGRR